MNAISRILAATDLSGPSRHAVDRGFRIAAEMKASYSVVHALELGSIDALFGLLGDRTPDVKLRLEEAAQAALDAMVGDPERNRGVAAQALVRKASPVEAILAEAARIAPGLLVLGARGESFLRHAFLGSTASRLLRKTTRHPVLVVKQPPHEPYRHVLVAVDFSAASLNAIRLARLLAPEAELVLFHAFSLPYEGKLAFAGVDDGIIRQYVGTTTDGVRKSLQRLAEEAGIDRAGYFAVVRHGDPIEQIVSAEQESDIDLIVLGKRGMRITEELLLGSVTSRVLERSQCDVAVIGDTWPSQ
jgi:nucleotide-binding universal stress UspA family protein